MPSILVAMPQIEEAAPLLENLRCLGYASDDMHVGIMRCAAVPALDILVAVAGHGKTQFGVQCQHLIDRSPEPKALLCVGAAGRLHHALAFGDVVLGTATVEHDYKLRFVREPLPCHLPDPVLLQEFKQLARGREFPFGIHFARIASGDEDVIDLERAEEIRAETDAVCVAWEGSGAARAACFSGLPFLEVRCITDGADSDAASSFHDNLRKVMPNVAELLVAWHAFRRAAA